jgi:hypothetical protein
MKKGGTTRSFDMMIIAKSVASGLSQIWKESMGWAAQDAA